MKMLVDGKQVKIVCYKVTGTDALCRIHAETYARKWQQARNVVSCIEILYLETKGVIHWEVCPMYWSETGILLPAKQHGIFRNTGEKDWTANDYTAIGL